jgi:hypothetical protein
MAIGNVSGATVSLLVSLRDEASRQLDSVTRNVDASARRMQSAGKIMAGFGIAGAAALGVIVRKGVSYGEMIDKISKQTGIAAEEVQKLKYAAEQEHLPFETLTKSIPILTKYMQYANEGMVTYKREFDRMGVSVVDGQGKLRSTYDVILDMAGYMSNQGVSAEEKMAVAMALLGRRGAEMLPFLKLGKEEIQRLAQEAEDLGAVMSGKDVAAAKKFSDELLRITAPLKVMTAELGISLLPILESWVEKGKRVIKWLHDLSPELKTVIARGALLTSVALILGGGMLFLAGTIKSLRVLKSATTAFNLFGTAMQFSLGALLKWLLMADLVVRAVGVISKAVGMLVETIGLMKNNSWLAEFGKGLDKAGTKYLKGGLGALAMDLSEGMMKGFSSAFGKVAEAAEKNMPKLPWDDFDPDKTPEIGVAPEVTKAAKSLQGSFGYALREIIGAYEYIPEMMKVQSRGMGPELMPVSLTPAFAGAGAGPGMKQVNLQFNFANRAEIHDRLDRELDREGL